VAEKTKHVPTVAVDLDGTLARHYETFDPKYIPPPKAGARKWLKKFQAAGARVIIFTVRGDDELTAKWLKEHELPCDYINENPDQPQGSSGKILADIYWDDRAISAAGPLDDSGPSVLSRLKIAGDVLVYADGPTVLQFLHLFKEMTSE
jgi:hypothetical protein